MFEYHLRLYLFYVMFAYHLILCLFYVMFEYRLILCLFYVMFEYHLILCLFYVMFKYRLILGCFVMLCTCTDMYLKTAEVWLRTSRLGQIVFRIYLVEQLLLYCNLRDFYLLQPPPSLRWAALLATALRYPAAYREPLQQPIRPRLEQVTQSIVLH